MRRLMCLGLVLWAALPAAVQPAEPARPAPFYSLPADGDWVEYAWKAIGPDRAKTYQVRPSELERYYQQRNLLKAKIFPSDVAEAVCFFISQRAAKTTGCVLTVDGGLREAFPR